MKLIFIYGPPASGKLTVAKELSSITGYRIFHNHLTIDLVASVFDRESEIFRPLIRKYRLDMIRRAAEEGIPGLIFTFMFRGKENADYVKKLVNAVERAKGCVLFVQLCCQPDELLRRVKYPSRKKFGKITDKKTLKEKMEQFDLFSHIRHKNNLTIDNTEITPKKVAQMIKNHYKL